MSNNQFSFATVQDFDNHIDKSVRGYSELIDDVVNISKFFVEDDRSVIDVGCSTGKMLEIMREETAPTAPNATFLGIECEPNFTKNLVEDGNLGFYKKDVREMPEHYWKASTLCTSIFTLQFMPRADRFGVVRSIYNGLEKGGAFIFAEKQYAHDPRVQDMLTFVHYGHKRKSFTDEEILDKEVSLRSIMRPSLRDDLVGLNGYVTKAGFTNCEPFWQNHNFCAYIAIK